MSETISFTADATSSSQPAMLLMPVDRGPLCAPRVSPVVIVLDIVDDVSIFGSLRWTRQNMYNKNKYTIQVLPHTASSEVWFV